MQPRLKEEDLPMNPRVVLLAIFAFVSFSAAAPAGRVRVWTASSAAHYDKARFKQTGVSNEGSVRLARQLHPLAGLDATHVWAVAEDSRRSLLIATGDEGKVYRLDSDGKLSVAFDSHESQILCLAAAPDGSVYAGTGPGGFIVRVPPGEQGRVIYRTPETYVWSLAFDPHRNTLFAGTGPRGRIYHVTPEGKGGVYYTTRQDHVLCLAAGLEDTLYAGTDKNGLVYRIDAHGKAFVLYQAPQAEVRALLVTSAGVYAGTSSPTHRRSGAPSAALDRPPEQSLAAALPSSLARPSAQSAAEDGGAGGVSSTKEHEPEKIHHGAPPSPASGENSLYLIAADGSVREIFRDRALILSLLPQGGRMLIGTGMDGQIFEVEPTNREHTEVARLDHGQIHCLFRRSDGSVVVGAGDPGKLYILQDCYTAQGSVVSEPHDARIVSHWGALRWKADTPPGTSLTLSVRSGNVADPDDTWSEWCPEQSDPAAGLAASPPARFLQYRVTLRTSDPAATPTFLSLAIRYATTNQPPEVSSVEVPDADATNLDSPKRVHFRWSASDPNDDDLTYALCVRKEGWTNWVQLEEALEKKEYDWDTTTTPSGVYRLKVIASDRKDNPDDEALAAERISLPFVVAHLPPTVTVKVAGMAGHEAVVEAVASDPLVRLTSASYALNGKKWVSVFPADGLFDSKSESFRFKTPPLKAGTYVLVLRVTDAAGNTGSADAVFSVRPGIAGR